MVNRTIESRVIGLQQVMVNRTIEISKVKDTVRNYFDQDPLYRIRQRSEVRL